MNRIYLGVMFYLMAMPALCIGYEMLACKIIALLMIGVGSCLFYDGLDKIDKRIKELEKKKDDQGN